MNRPPIFLINLDRDEKRRAQATAQLDEYGLAFERIVAKDKGELTEEDRSNYSKFQAKLSTTRELADGEIACAISHYDAWETFLNRNAPIALILEDDFIIDHRLPQLLDVIDKFQDQIDCLLLRTDRRAEPFGEEVIPGHRLTRFRKRPNRTCAYLLTRHGAQTLQDYRYPIRMPVDDLVGSFRIHQLKVRGLSPQIVSLSESDSSIWKSASRPSKSRFYRKVRSALRRVTNYY